MNWVHSLWFGYFYLSIKGNGPEALAQTVLYGLIAIAVVPPIHRWFVAEHERLKAHISAEHAAVHRKLDHIILHHPDIPPYEETHE